MKQWHPSAAFMRRQWPKIIFEVFGGTANVTRGSRRVYERGVTAMGVVLCSIHMLVHSKRSSLLS